jgi:D-aminopeptidase
MTQEQKDQQVVKARRQAAAEVAANRPRIEASMREKLEPAVEATVRVELTNRVRAEVAANMPAETPSEDLFGLKDKWKHIYGTRTVVDWMAMMAIIAVLLAIILFLIKRKDVV